MSNNKIMFNIAAGLSVILVAASLVPEVNVLAFFGWFTVLCVFAALSGASE